MHRATLQRQAVDRLRTAARSLVHALALHRSAPRRQTRADPRPNHANSLLWHANDLLRQRLRRRWSGLHQDWRGVDKQMHRA